MKMRIRLALLLAVFLQLAAGCRSKKDQTTSADPAAGPQRTVRVLVIDDPQLGPLIEREWRARTQGSVELAEKTADEILAVPPDRLAADVVVYPSGLIGELAERNLIDAIPAAQRDAAELAFRDVFAAPRLGECRWGEEVFAVTLGSPQLTLLYRKDIFQQLDLRPPATWAAYQQLAARLAAREELGELAAPQGQPWSATIEPLGPGWAGQVLLARAAAYARHRSHYATLFQQHTMQPQIAAPPFVRALEELLAAAPLGPADARTQSPAHARRAFFAGQAAMALTWPTRARAEDDPPTARPLPVGFAALPASRDVFNLRRDQWETRPEDESEQIPLLAASGRLVSFTRQGRRSPAALALLLWLGGTELGAEIAPESAHTTLYRPQHVAQAALWVNRQLDADAARQYGKLVETIQSSSMWLPSLRIPGRSQYLAALDEAVWQALGSADAAAIPAAEALAVAAARWDEITDRLGRAAQADAYTRSLGQKP